MSYCFPCALTELVNKVVVADPSARNLHGCCGNACVTYCSWNLLGYMTCPCIGPAMVTSTILTPLQTRVASPGTPIDDCCTMTCCGPCKLIQMMNEVDLRQKSGQPIVPQQMMMVMMTPPATMNPMMAAPQQ